jgi:hypothetical protein
MNISLVTYLNILSLQGKYCMLRNRIEWLYRQIIHIVIGTNDSCEVLLFLEIRTAVKPKILFTDYGLVIGTLFPTATQRKKENKTHCRPLTADRVHCRHCNMIQTINMIQNSVSL